MQESSTWTLLETLEWYWLIDLENHIIHAGNRTAQLICEKAKYPVLQEVHQLQSTTRGAGGFESTGFKVLTKHLGGYK